jgi:hypothetical protein
MMKTDDEKVCLVINQEAHNGIDLLSIQEMSEEVDPFASRRSTRFGLQIFIGGSPICNQYPRKRRIDRCRISCVRRQFLGDGYSS